VIDFSDNPFITIWEIPRSPVRIDESSNAANSANSPTNIKWMAISQATENKGNDSSQVPPVFESSIDESTTNELSSQNEEKEHHKDDEISSKFSAFTMPEESLINHHDDRPMIECKDVNIDIAVKLFNKEEVEEIEEEKKENRGSISKEIEISIDESKNIHNILEISHVHTSNENTISKDVELPVEILKEGINVIKYGRWGKPHQRKIFLNQEGTRICWKVPFF
jgi:hypothetical protein